MGKSGGSITNHFHSVHQREIHTRTRAHTHTHPYKHTYIFTYDSNKQNCNTLNSHNNIHIHIISDPTIYAFQNSIRFDFPEKIEISIRFRKTNARAARVHHGGMRAHQRRECAPAVPVRPCSMLPPRILYQ